MDIDITKVENIQREYIVQKKEPEKPYEWPLYDIVTTGWIISFRDDTNISLPPDEFSKVNWINSENLNFGINVPR